MKLCLMCLVLIGVLACASKKDEKYEKREFKKTYTVTEASLNAFPEWIDKPESYDDSSEGATFRYFTSFAENKNQRLCLRSAEVRATAQIASEITQFVKNTYGESSLGGDALVEHYMEESLASEAQAFVVGARVERTYWEKRKYEVKLGANEERSIYQCFALVKMDKKHLEKAVNSSLEKLYSNISKPEVKAKTQEILKDVAQKFNELKEE